MRIGAEKSLPPLPLGTIVLDSLPHPQPSATVSLDTDLSAESAVAGKEGVGFGRGGSPWDYKQEKAWVYGIALACSVTRRASALAFREKGRAMTSPDMIERVGLALEELLR